MTTLEIKINKANEAYRNGNPIMSDHQYDEMLIELMQVYPESELLKTGVIEKPKTRMEKLPHSMFSLNKLTSLKEIAQWIKSNCLYREEIIITPKLDAISMLVNEENADAWTRGDGIEGQVSTNHLANFEKVKGLFSIFTSGEVIMEKRFFEESVHKFQKQDPPYANPRNMAAGLFNADDFENPDLKYFNYIRYSVHNDKLSKAEQLDICNELNKEKIPYILITVAELLLKGESYLDYLYNKWNNSPFEIDGLVMDINSSETRLVLGREKNNNPKYARAIKLDWEEKKIAKATGIEWNISKEGLLKPVILIKPIHLAGVTVSRATGYNAAYIFDNNIARDSLFEIKRSGEVIPKHIKTTSYITEEVNKEKEKNIFCPSCGSILHWTKNNKGESVDLKCMSLGCSEKHIKKMVHFFKVMDIDNFSEPSIRKLYNHGYDTAISILKMEVSDFIDIDGFGSKSVNALMKEFNDKIFVGINWIKFGHAMSIFEGLGTKKLILFANLFSKDYGLNELKEVNVKRVLAEEILNKIPGLSTKTINSFFKGLPKLILKIHIFESYGMTITYPCIQERVVNEGLLGGKVFVFSGFRNKDLEQSIVNKGGLIVSSISKKVTHLIVKDKNANTSKIQKAKNLEIEIINQEEIF